MNILDEICEYARERTRRNRTQVPFSEVKRRALALAKGDMPFSRALGGGRAVIAEVKRSSPSKGIIAEHFTPTETAAEYAAGGADCISVLTEPKWFGGSDEIFAAVRGAVSVPLLMKDFVVDEYRLYEAKLLGADCVLLIVAALGENIKPYMEICDELGLDALVETHSAAEIELAASAGARIIGVNNRNLGDFSVDLSLGARLSEYIPKGALFVAESGITSPSDAVESFRAGADAVLCGEALMRAHDRAAFIREVKNG